MGGCGLPAPVSVVSNLNTEVEMAKRRKTVVAGRLVFETAYTAALPSDAEHVRQAKMKMSSAARRRLNLKAACRQLELLIAANLHGAIWLRR